MFILDLNLGISVGLLKFGIDRQVVWKIMKEKYKCERESLTDGREYYGALDLLLKYKNDKLYMAQFIADPKNKVCEIKLNGEKFGHEQEKNSSLFLNNITLMNF